MCCRGIMEESVSAGGAVLSVQGDSCEPQELCFPRNSDTSGCSGASW